MHGLSRVYDQSAYEWRDGAWRGRDLAGGLVYELHVGTFTPGATLDSAIERLDHLVGLGVTHVELLPVNAVNGVWNWGYDGVGWYAVHAPYGGPDALKRFVDACHARGLAVLLDVVYNHLGPSGNYLPEFGSYLKPGRNTWGDLVNLEEPAGAPVRARQRADVAARLPRRRAAARRRARARGRPHRRTSSPNSPTRSAR